MTAIMTITRDGPLYTLMVQKDSVKADDFVSYFTLQDSILNYCLLGILANQRFCYYLDNARIHNKQKLNDVLKNTGHKIIFNTPYSPEMNPIEMIFSIWKDMVDKEIGYDIPTLSEVVEVVEETWDKIDLL